MTKQDKIKKTEIVKEIHQLKVKWVFSIFVIYFISA